MAEWLRGSLSIHPTDFGIGMAGAGTAVASVVFACVMLMSDTSHPSFGGGEYLLLFTRPLHAVTPDRPQLAAAGRHRPLGVDYTATGSIGTAAQDKTSDSNGDPAAQASETAKTRGAPMRLSKDYALSSVSGGVATIKSPKGSFVVETGSLMPNGDLVVSIDRREGRWVVVTSGGLIAAR
jgi:hypothetical protein